MDSRRLTFITTDPYFLSQGEAQLGRQYPVDPAWLVRGSAFDMDAFLTRNFETTMVTYENGDSWANKLKVGAHEEYDRPRGGLRLARCTARKDGAAPGDFLRVPFFFKVARA
jgi:hypothetical protein